MGSAPTTLNNCVVFVHYSFAKVETVARVECQSPQDDSIAFSVIRPEVGVGCDTVRSALNEVIGFASAALDINEFPTSIGARGKLFCEGPDLVFGEFAPFGSL